MLLSAVEGMSVSRSHRLYAELVARAEAETGFKHTVAARYTDRVVEWVGEATHHEKGSALLECWRPANETDHADHILYTAFIDALLWAGTSAVSGSFHETLEALFNSAYTVSVIEVIGNGENRLIRVSPKAYQLAA